MVGFTLTLMTEREIIEGCKGNDRRCQEALYKMFAGRMKVTCSRYLTSSADIKDVLQDGFVKVFTNINRFNYEGSFDGWVRRIIVNTCLTKVTKYNHNEEVELIPEIHESYEYKNIIGNMHVKEIRDMIASLPVGYKTIFNMAVIDGFTHVEIAIALKISENTSRTQLLKARKALQELIIKSEQIIEHDRGQ